MEDWVEIKEKKLLFGHWNFSPFSLNIKAVKSLKTKVICNLKRNLPIRGRKAKIFSWKISTTKSLLARILCQKLSLESLILDCIGKD